MDMVTTASDGVPSTGTGEGPQEEKIRDLEKEGGVPTGPQQLSSRWPPLSLAGRGRWKNDLKAVHILVPGIQKRVTI